MEKGMRAALLGSKPHSKGEDFSRSMVDRALSTQAKVKTINGKNTVMKVVTVIKIIS